MSRTDGSQRWRQTAYMLYLSTSDMYSLVHKTILRVYALMGWDGVRVFSILTEEYIL